MRGHVELFAKLPIGEARYAPQTAIITPIGQVFIGPHLGQRLGTPQWSF